MISFYVQGPPGPPGPESAGACSCKKDEKVSALNQWVVFDLSFCTSFHWMYSYSIKLFLILVCIVCLFKGIGEEGGSVTKRKSAGINRICLSMFIGWCFKLVYFNMNSITHYFPFISDFALLVCVLHCYDHWHKHFIRPRALFMLHSIQAFHSPEPIS